MSTLVSAAPAALPLRIGTPDECRRLRQALLDAGYTAAEIRRRGGLTGGAPADGSGAAARDGWRALATEMHDALGVLLRLFLAGEPVAWADARALMSDDLVALLGRFGLLAEHRDACRCIATVHLYPVDSVYIASDRLWPDDPPEGAHPDFVFAAITTNTQRFLSLVPWSPCAALLELCAGAAPAALLGAPTAGWVWATDITERATRFAEFNAALNGITNVTVRRGDLYACVAGQTFDRIVAHPPYLPRPGIQMIYRDGGDDGEHVTRRIVAGVPDHLRPGGRLYCVCLATDRAGAPVEQRVRALLGEREGEFDVLVADLAPATPPLEYWCTVAARDDTDFSFAEVDQAAARFRGMGIEQVAYCAIVVQRRAGARPVFTVRRLAGPETRAPELDWALAWETAMTEPAATTALLAARPTLARRVELRTTYLVRDGVLAPHACTVRVPYPFDFDVECPPWIAGFFAACDGRATLGEHFARLAERGALPSGAEDRFAAFVAPLVGAGVLVLPNAPLPS